ncbi:hypothetical protein HMI55_000872 [Coelomomyces lativittatus]|nr:hypothetical protein HMI55_000872 [Coelomomyces lativittatus]
MKSIFFPTIALLVFHFWYSSGLPQSGGEVTNLLNPAAGLTTSVFSVSQVRFTH